MVQTTLYYVLLHIENTQNKMENEKKPLGSDEIQAMLVLIGDPFVCEKSGYGYYGNSLGHRYYGNSLGNLPC